MDEPVTDVIVVGGGLAGLACAAALVGAGVDVRLVEKAAEVGGRVRTDGHDGFLLDHGFQVFLTAYPCARSPLDLAALRVGRFDPGAVLQLPGGRRCVVSDPLRQPWRLVTTALAPIGSLRDKLLILKLRARLQAAPPEWTPEWTAVSSYEWLREFGFSEVVIGRFFKPFFKGVFLESGLATAAWMLGYTYHYFANGYAVLPAGGMREIPRQLLRQIGPERVTTGVAVKEVAADRVTLADGTMLRARAVVAAADGDSARRWFPELPARAWQAAACYYFDAPASPLGGRRAIFLNATGRGRISQIAVPSDIADGYAPAGRSLVSVGVVGDEDARADAAEVLEEARALIGPAAASWRFLKSYHIPQALPDASPGALAALGDRPALIRGVHLCGDHRSVGSIDAAIAGGTACADAVARELGR